MTVSERRRAIIEALSIRKYDTSENLASQFGVTVRTVYNDITALSLEYPIYTLQGNGGGIYVEEGYRLDRQYLSDEQSELLESLLPQLSGERAEIMQSILSKFKLKNHKEKKK